MNDNKVFLFNNKSNSLCERKWLNTLMFRSYSYMVLLEIESHKNEKSVNEKSIWWIVIP